MISELANHRTLTRAALAAVILAAPITARAQTNYAAEAPRIPAQPLGRRPAWRTDTPT